MPSKAGGQRRRPTQDRARATREHILDTAARLFGERGIEETSTNRIAATAGVSVGTVYRYFSDRSVIIEELIDRLVRRVEERFTQRLFGRSGGSVKELVTGILEAIDEELVDNAPLIRALSSGVHFYSSGLPELEPRLRLLVKVLVIQMLGPGDDHKYDVMTFVLINTGFATLLRASELDAGSAQRKEAIEMTARMITAWAETEMDAATRPA
ncbi:AcrR family transcriptional regulator [Nocardia transvalensis]|uniref:AcrR family transcriptional regulator n=1 Tax=Nocardia transvalensis TaxID=37333 RepID=A0A7W9UM71_9NOCA|nr:TetR/AcrR family transcriptional regulator [Nocardia transvalensis]MBB5918288.1 AcrR family transcriptional regulator [Nocardia transvalensis]